jgi:hypothetical protein
LSVHLPDQFKLLRAHQLTNALNKSWWPSDKSCWNTALLLGPSGITDHPDSPKAILLSRQLSAAIQDSLHPLSSSLKTSSSHPIKSVPIHLLYNHIYSIQQHLFHYLLRPRPFDFLSCTSFFLASPVSYSSPLTLLLYPRSFFRLSTISVSYPYPPLSYPALACIYHRPTAFKSSLSYYHIPNFAIHSQ